MSRASFFRDSRLFVLHSRFILTYLRNYSIPYRMAQQTKLKEYACVRLRTDELKAIARLAAHEHRPLSGMIRELLLEALAGRNGRKATE